jgi:hypothetical protein
VHALEANTDDIVADILTKSLSHDKYWKFVRAMRLQPCSSGNLKDLSQIGRQRVLGVCNARDIPQTK